MLNLHFLNVGNGDFIVVEFNNGSSKAFGVIDCNRTFDRPSAAKDKLIELGAEKLSFICITHPDQDHYTGLLDVLDHFSGKVAEFFTFPLSGVGAVLKSCRMILACARVG